MIVFVRALRGTVSQGRTYFIDRDRMFPDNSSGRYCPLFDHSTSEREMSTTIDGNE